MDAIKFLIIGCLAGFIWVFWIEPRWFQLREITLRLKKPLKNPFTILHVSDMHFTKRHRAIEGFFDRLSQLEPDFVFVTGDLIDHAKGIEPCVANLKKLRPKKGIYAILGNHDYRNYPPFRQWFGAFSGKDVFSHRPEEETEQLKKALEKAGIELLLNRHVTLPLSDGEELVLIGLDDPVSGRADLEKAFEGIKNGAAHLALAHSPMVFPELGRFDIDAAFAGHTHGGQIRLPGLGPLFLAKWVSPIIDSTNEFGFHGIVSRGLSAQPKRHLRFLCRPEAVLVRVEGSG